MFYENKIGGHIASWIKGTLLQRNSLGKQSQENSQDAISHSQPPSSCPVFPCLPGTTLKVLDKGEGGSQARWPSLREPPAVPPAGTHNVATQVPLLSLPPHSIFIQERPVSWHLLGMQPPRRKRRCCGTLEPGCPDLNPGTTPCHLHDLGQAAASVGTSSSSSESVSPPAPLPGFS